MGKGGRKTSSELIKNVTLRNGIEDRLLWKHGKNGSFAVKTCTEVIECQRGLQDCFVEKLCMENESDKLYGTLA